MTNSKKFLLVSLLILSSTAYSAELLNKDGYVLDVFGLTNIGVSSQTIKIDDYKNTKSGVDEDAAWFQVGIKKRLGNMEAGLHLRYGAGFEANTDRTGGDMYIKYHFNDKLSLEYAKSDFKYTDYTDYGTVVGKNLGTGTQLELTPDGMILDPVLSMLEVDYGVAFLGAGLDDIAYLYKSAGFTPTGGIWSAHMAYSENANNHDLKPGAFNLYYNTTKFSLATSGVYASREASNYTNDNDTDDFSDDYLENIKAKDTGLTVKGIYSLNKDIKIGGGATYGNGNTDSSVDANDIETTIISQNLWAKTKIAGFDVFAEVAHSTSVVDSNKSYMSHDSDDIIENTLASDKSLVGTYIKISKFVPKVGIPAVEIKLAQSTFDKAGGFKYTTAQKNTLFEIKPSLTIPSHKAPMLLYGVNATLGSYKSENVGGTSGTDEKSTQVKIGTSVTYIF